MPSGSTGTSREFVDTNMLVYAQDPRDPTKQAHALGTVQRLSNERRMVVSTQVITELCAVLLRCKAGRAVRPGDLAALVDEIEATADIVVVTPSIVKEAARAAATYSLA